MPAPLFLCTDLDRTLLPNGSQPESPGARRAFARLAERPEVTLAYVTGRHRARVADALTLYDLPRPRFVISDVGTQIYELHEGGWRTLHEWHREIAPDWNGLRHSELHDLLGVHRDLRMQERDRQSMFKLSYYVPLHTRHEALLARMEQSLAARGVRASLIWSVDEPAGKGLLDVLPRSASKLHAVEFLRERLGFGVEETLFAGVSGNDLPALVSHLPAVLVANASAAVRERARAEAEALGNAERLYLASGALPHMNGNYSAGILEGVAHFRPADQSLALGET